MKADATAELKAIRKLLEVAHAPAALLGREEMAALLGCGLSTFDRLKAAGVKIEAAEMYETV